MTTLQVTPELTLALKERGYSMTRPRALIFNALANSDEPMSMHELYAQCAQDIDRTSLYRTIDIFEKCGVIERVQIGWKYKIELSEAFSSHHHHIVCAYCGEVTSFEENEDIKKAIYELATSLHYELTAHHLELRGVCSNCRTN